MSSRNYRTLAMFEGASAPEGIREADRLPVPLFAEAFSLTVGQLFSWLRE
jgi:hypothetical protein